MYFSILHIIDFSGGFDFYKHCIFITYISKENQELEIIFGTFIAPHIQGIYNIFRKLGIGIFTPLEDWGVKDFYFKWKTTGKIWDD